MVLQAVIVAVLVLLFFSNTVRSQFVIETLPGFHGKLPSKLETGYIGVGEMEEVQLFYYFIASEGNPDVDPLMLWMSGGPGCTGLSGLLYEIGPFSTTTDYGNSSGGVPRLISNPNSWTQAASFIFIDQPVGTGFSYANSYEAYFTSDTLSATHTYQFLTKWLINHPKYLKNPLYIGGDSYGGKIVPLVVNEIYNGNDVGAEPPINIKGLILGNPYTDDGLDNWRYLFANRMGLLSDKLYKSAIKNCNGDLKQVDPHNILCQTDIQKIQQCLNKIRRSHILEPWCPSMWNSRRELLSPDEINPSKISIQHRQSTSDSHCREDNYVPCYTWANNKIVQKALHIREETIREWVRCNASIAKSQSESYTKNVQSTVEYHKNLTRRNCRALIYSGDHDSLVPHISTESWINSLNLSILSDWRPWFLEDQVAGFTMRYSNGDYKLTYATVKGAGHTAPEYKPSECLAMFRRWLSNSSL